MEMLAKTLFTNANLVLDEFAELQKSFDVLVGGGRILSVSQTPIDHGDAKVIDVRGRTLMPGLIDEHFVSSLRNRHCRNRLSAA